jgi:hypothetical protein
MPAQVAGKGLQSATAAYAGGNGALKFLAAWQFNIQPAKIGDDTCKNGIKLSKIGPLICI